MCGLSEGPRYDKEKQTWARGWRMGVGVEVRGEGLEGSCRWSREAHSAGMMFEQRPE